MKTQTKGLANILKRIAITSFIMALAVSCGSSNSSGNGSSSSSSSAFGTSFGNTSIYGQSVSIDSALTRIATLNPCSIYGQTSTARHTYSVAVNGQGTLSKPVVGITTEGDIAILTSNGANYTLTVSACSRTDLQTTSTAQLQSAANPLPYSHSCLDGLVANVRLQAQYGYYNLAFFPATSNFTTSQQICGI